ncbi:hypothetical protein AB1Y20_001096 [Prymnesium parvum]|uniref:Uncharacterized protein n=1 Tax=Prymnesium parvum TaxID=97485 RepID=A0AB34K7S1_PRYPA
MLRRVLPFLAAAASAHLAAPNAEAASLAFRLPVLARGCLQRARDASQDFQRRFSRSRLSGDVAQPAFAGSWRSVRADNIDDFLDRAMGVSYLKRKIAAKASQTQRLYQQGSVVHLEITDGRGTMKYQLFPDGRVVSAKGFMKMPIKQRARWGTDGSLLTEEQYDQPLGDAEPRPLVQSCRSVTKSGEMLVEVKRTLLCGETISMRTWYCRLPSKEKLPAFVRPLGT